MILWAEHVLIRSPGFVMRCSDFLVSAAKSAIAALDPPIGAIDGRNDLRHVETAAYGQAATQSIERDLHGSERRGRIVLRVHEDSARNSRLAREGAGVKR